MTIYISTERFYEVLVEHTAITPECIYQELVDRAVEIEVSLDDIQSWLDTEQVSLVVADDFGDIISLKKSDTDISTTPYFEACDAVECNDRLTQVMNFVHETPEIDMDIGHYPYDVRSHPSEEEALERLRRWVESHPVQWHKMTLDDIAKEVNLGVSTIFKHLPECVISAKYVDTVVAYKQKRRQSRSYKKGSKKVSPSITKIHEWLKANYKKWQSKTFTEISQETETSVTAVYKNLPKLLLAEGFVSSLYDYENKRKQNRGYKGKRCKSDETINYFIEVI